MTDDRSSFVITSFLQRLADVMPEEERAKVAPYERRAAVAGSEQKAEWQRAYKCAKWAERIVALPAHRHLAAEAERAIEALKEIEKTLGAELPDLNDVPFSSGPGATLSLALGGGKGYPVSARLEAEIEWSFEAVHVAEKVAAQVGWGKVPWEALVEEMLAIG